MLLVTELKRRNVFQVTAAYLVVGWLLTEVLTTILPALGAPGWAPRAVILIFALGFVPTVVLSWVYQITPDGIRKDTQAGSDDPVRRRAAGTADYLAIAATVLLVLGVAFFGAMRSTEEVPARRGEAVENSVAVLPFVNMSNDKDNEYLSDGLTETLLHMLVQIPDLKVAARTSSFAFRGRNMDIREIAAALQVAHVLEGSVQKSGRRIRITAQLIRAADGFHLFSETYDTASEDIFAIQDEIAARVRDTLSASLLGTAGRPGLAGVETTNADAYDLYLQALKEEARFSYGGLRAAEELFKGALAIDPDFLDAKAALAANYLQQYETGLMHGDRAFAQAIALAEQVLATRPDHAETRAIKLFAGAVPRSNEGNPGLVAEAIRQLDKLVREHPGAYRARVLLSRLLQGTGQFESALRIQQEALARDPYNARIHYEVGSMYLELGRLDAARAALQKSIQIEPGQPNAYMRLGAVALKTGDGVEYVRQYLEALKVDPRDHEIPGMIAVFLYELGLVDEADYFRDRVLAIAPTSEAAYRVELLRAIATGDEVAAIAAARRAIEDDIDERQFSYGGAVRYLLRAAARNGTVAEESAYLERFAPGILDVDATGIPLKYRLAQRVAIDAWYTTLPRGELLRRIARIRDAVMPMGLDDAADPASRVEILLLKDDVEAAIELALSEVFTQPVTRHPDWENTLAQAHFSELVADARIAAAMQAWEKEHEQLRRRVRQFLGAVSAG